MPSEALMHVCMYVGWLVVVYHYYNHIGSCCCHISTTIPPMDLKPLAFVASGADAHDAVPTVPCKHYMDHAKRSTYVCMYVCRLVGSCVPLLRPYAWDLVVAISLQLYHL